MPGSLCSLAPGLIAALGSGKRLEMPLEEGTARESRDNANGG